MSFDDQLDGGLFHTEVVPPEVDMIIRLRNHLAVVRGANHLLAERWDELADAERTQLLDLALKGSAQLTDDIDTFADMTALTEAPGLQW